MGGILRLAFAVFLSDLVKRVAFCSLLIGFGNGFGRKRAHELGLNFRLEECRVIRDLELLSTGTIDFYRYMSHANLLY